MSNLPIKDASNTTRKVDVFLRTEGADTVEVQAIAVVDPATGNALVPTAGGKMPIEVAALPLPAGAATQATLATLLTAAQAIQAATEALNTGAIGGTVALDAPTLAALESITANGPLTDAQLRAAGVPVLGTFWQATQPVSGTFWQATQPVSFNWDGLTDTQLRAAALPVSGTFWQATQPISAAALPLPAGAASETTLAAVEAKLPALSGGRLPVELPPGGGGLTDAELRADDVPVSVAGELLEAIEALRMGIQSLNRTMGMTTVDVAGRLRTTLENGSVLGLVNNVTTMTTLTTLATMTNQAQLGGFAANDEVPSLMRMSADGLRRNITVT